VKYSFQNVFLLQSILNPAFVDFFLAVRQDVPDSTPPERARRTPGPQPSSTGGSRRAGGAHHQLSRGLHPRHGPLRPRARGRRENHRLAGNVNIVRVDLVIVLLRRKAQPVAAARVPRYARSRVPILPHVRAHRRGGPPLPALLGQGATAPREEVRRRRRRQRQEAEDRPECGC